MWAYSLIQPRMQSRGLLHVDLNHHGFIHTSIVVTLPCATMAASIDAVRNDNFAKKTVVVYGREMRKISIREVSSDVPFLGS